MEIKSAAIPDLEERFLEPPGWRWGTLDAQGFRIRFGHVSPPEPEAIIVCLPGLSEFCEKYFETARYFLERNMAFWVLDWPGQGLSGALLPGTKKRHSFGFARERDIIHYLFTRHIEPANVHGAPCALLAHSMGGNIALRYLAAYPQVFSCAALSAPMVGLMALRGLPWPLPGLITGFMKMYFGTSYPPGQVDWNEDVRANPESNIFSHDSVRAGVHNAWCTLNPEMQVGGVTWRWLYEAHKSCMLIQNRKFAQAIKTPCLIGMAGHEELVDNAAARRVGRMIGADMVDYPDALHELLMERDEIRNDFLNRFLGLISRIKAY